MMFFAIRVGVFEQRKSGNEMRHKEAFHAAETGVQAAYAYLLDNTQALTDFSDNGWLSDWQGLQDRLGDVGEVTASAPFLLGQGMLTKGREVHGALIRGMPNVYCCRVKTDAGPVFAPVELGVARRAHRLRAGPRRVEDAAPLEVAPGADAEGGTDVQAVFDRMMGSFKADAAASHTGSLAGEDAICDAVFRQAGIIRLRVDDVLERAPLQRLRQRDLGQFPQLIGTDRLLRIPGRQVGFELVEAEIPLWQDAALADEFTVNARTGQAGRSAR